MITQIDHVNIVVRNDLEPMVAFYSDLLGLKVTKRVQISGPWVSSTVCLPDVAADVVYLDPPAGPRLELIRYLHPTAPTRLAQHARLPTGHWNGERAATDILVLAAKGKAFRCLDKLLVRQGGHQVLPGSTVALAAATRAWAQLTNTPPTELISALIH